MSQSELQKEEGGAAGGDVRARVEPPAGGAPGAEGPIVALGKVQEPAVDDLNVKVPLNCSRAVHCHFCVFAEESGLLQPSETNHGCCGLAECFSYSLAVIRVLQFDVDALVRSRPDFVRSTAQGLDTSAMFRFESFKYFSNGNLMRDRVALRFDSPPGTPKRRILMPSCLLHQIRSRFPSPVGYVGAKRGAPDAVDGPAGKRQRK